MDSHRDSEKKKNRFGLAAKATVGLSIMSVCIMACTAYVGIRTYSASITARYNDMAYQIAETAKGYFTGEELARYADLTYRYNRGEATDGEVREVTESARYQEILRQIRSLRDSMGANDIFVFVFDVEVLKNYSKEAEEAGTWHPLYYIADSYPAGEQQFGESSTIFEEYIEDSIKACETGVHADNYFISEGEYGYNTSAMYPVVQDGETVAFIGVEIPMSTLQGSIWQYLVKVLAVGSIVTLALLLVFQRILAKILISPVRQVAAAASEFVTNNNSVRKKLEEIHTHDEIQVLSESVIKMEQDIGSYIEDLTRVTAEKERIGAELDIASNIQKSMLPCIFPPFPDREEFDIYAAMDPAKEVGGDFYDFFMVDDRHLAVVVADVSGKGVPAALFMVIGKTLIKDHTQLSDDLGAVFTEVNDLLCEANSEGLFITAFEGVLDLVTGEFEFVNAGHERPFICKRGGRFTPCKIRAAFVLAGMEGMKYRCGTMQMEPGDKLFQYTDGVTEATNQDKELYGMERLEDVLGRNAKASPQELLYRVKEDIDAFAGEEPQFDDITMLCLEFRKRMEVTDKHGV